MEEDSEDEPHGHITSLAVKRSHRSSSKVLVNCYNLFIEITFMLQETWFGSEAHGSGL